MSITKSSFVASFMILVICSCSAPKEPVKEETMTKEVEVKQPESVLRHVVMFKFKEDADPAAVTKIEKAFAELPSQISEIKDYEWGVNNSPEGLNKGLTHCFFVTFHSEEGRAAYLPHPAHKAFVALLDGVLDDVTVLDYWSK